MHRHIKKVGVLTLGVIFIILGLLGLVLPVLQGILFLLIGLMLISLYSKTVRGWVEYIAKQHPKLERMLQKADSWIKRRIGEP